MNPTYYCMIPIYSMCNMHDLSWGNRESAGGIRKTNPQFISYRNRLLIFWIIVNFSTIIGMFYLINFIENTLEYDLITVQFIKILIYFPDMIIGYIFYFLGLIKWKLQILTSNDRQKRFTS